MALTKILTEGIKDGEILNVDIDDNASIAKSKLASLNILNTDINANAGIVSTKLAKPIDFADNEKARFGTGSDLQIYHDGTDSYLQNATGDLYIQTTGSGDDIFLSAIDDVQINVAGGTGAKVIGDGAVELYFNGTKRLETTSIGATVTGNVIIDAPDNVTSTGGDWALKLQGGDTNNDIVNLRFATDADGSLAQVSALAEITGSYPNSSGALLLSVQAGGATYEAMRINSARKVLIGTTTKGHSAADDLTISSAGDMGITLRSTDSGQGAVYFSDGTSGADEYRGIINYNHASNFFSIFTDSTEKVRIHSGGQIQLGGTSLSNVSSFADDLVIGQSGSTAINGLTFCSTNSSGIRFHDTGDAGELEFNHSDNSFTTSADGLLKYRTNSAERMRIDSSGNVMIKNTAPGHTGWADTLTIGNTSGNHGLTIRSATNGYGNIYFSDATSGNGTDSYKGMITYRHTDETMEIAANHGGSYIRLNSNGLMINSTSASNALDDYEEGIHVMAPSGTSDFAISASYDEAPYTKIGRLVTLRGLIYISAVTGSGGYVRLTLPFTAANDQAGVRYSGNIGAVMHNGVNTGDCGVVGYISGNSNHMDFYKVSDNSSWSILVASDLTVGDEMYFTISYEV